MVWDQFTSISEASAFPFGDNTLLLAPLIVYPPDGPELEKTAAKLGEGLRQILYEGSSRRSELHTYVNYAFGDESLRNMYGYLPAVAPGSAALIEEQVRPGACIRFLRPYRVKEHSLAHPTILLH